MAKHIQDPQILIKLLIQFVLNLRNHIHKIFLKSLLYDFFSDSFEFIIVLVMSKIVSSLLYTFSIKPTVEISQKLLPKNCQLIVGLRNRYTCRQNLKISSKLDSNRSLSLALIAAMQQVVFCKASCFIFLIFNLIYSVVHSKPDHLCKVRIFLPMKDFFKDIEHQSLL